MRFFRNLFVNKALKRSWKLRTVLWRVGKRDLSNKQWEKAVLKVKGHTRMKWEFIDMKSRSIKCTLPSGEFFVYGGDLVGKRRGSNGSNRR